jgi:hypothetical protein
MPGGGSDAMQIIAKSPLTFLSTPLPTIRYSYTQAAGDGHKGIVGHVQATRVYQKSTHTDPGPEFS